ncbi:MAG TPA: plastocyanin/azurin family copper-binding protein, partial [Thermoleophilaceae bacterium]
MTATNTGATNIFDPPTVNIQAGDSVTWTWGGSNPHSVTSDMSSPMSFDSGIRSPGASFTIQFPTAGAFTYHCIVHPGMNGTVVVAPASGGGGGGDGSPPGATPGDTVAPAVSALKVQSRWIRFALSEPAKLTGSVKKGARRV